MIDSEALPDPGVVSCLEANEFTDGAHLCFRALGSRCKVSFLINCGDVRVGGKDERICELAI